VKQGLLGERGLSLTDHSYKTVSGRYIQAYSLQPGSGRCIAQYIAGMGVGVARDAVRHVSL